MKTTQEKDNGPKIVQQKSKKQQSPFKDGRSEAVMQGNLYDMVNNSNQVTQMRSLQSMADNREQDISFEPIQRKVNNTGLPDNLKSGIEHLSGYSMDDVKVHYNSDKPAQLQAHAYAQGTDIHLGAGQEKHLPHEAWHVVQQKQGRVKPTMQMKGKVNVNDDKGLEREADVMGAKAVTVNSLNTDNTLNQGFIQNKDAPVQGFFGRGTKLTSEASLKTYADEKYKELVEDRLMNSKDLRRALGDTVRSWSSFGRKTTNNRDLRNSAKDKAREKYNEAIDDFTPTATSGSAMLGLAKDRSKVEAYKGAKGIVKEEVHKVLVGLAATGHNAKERYKRRALRAFNSTGADHKKIKEQLKNELKALRVTLKRLALDNISQDKHPLENQQNLTTKLTDDIGNVDYTAKADNLVREKLKAKNVGKGMQMIGGLINMAVPFPGTEAGIEIELSIPVASVMGAAEAYVTLGFSGEASKDEDSSGKQEIGTKAKMSIGAKFEVARVLDFSVGVGGFIEAQAQNIEKLMSLFSYGGYRLADGISKKLSSTLWGYGGKTGQSKETEAGRWAAAMEEDTLKGSDNEDNFVELGAVGEVGADVNVGIGKLGLGLEIGGGRRYDKDTVGAVGSDGAVVLNDGKKTFFTSLSAELEPNFDGFGAAFGISGSFKRVRDYIKSGGTIDGENEWEFVIGAQLSTGLGNSKNEKVDKIIRWISAIAVPAATWANMFTKKSQKEATDVVGAVGQTINGGAIASLLNDKANTFAEDIVGKMGSEASSLTGDMEDNLQSNVALALEFTITHDGDGWGISLALKEVKETSISLGTFSAKVEKSTRLVEVGTADGGYIKGMGLNKARTP